MSSYIRVLRLGLVGLAPLGMENENVAPGHVDCDRYREAARLRRPPQPRQIPIQGSHFYL